jgi:hypothetical protein
MNPSDLTIDFSVTGDEFTEKLKTLAIVAEVHGDTFLSDIGKRKADSMTPKRPSRKDREAEAGRVINSIIDESYHGERYVTSDFSAMTQTGRSFVKRLLHKSPRIQRVGQFWRVNASHEALTSEPYTHELEPSLVERSRIGLIQELGSLLKTANEIEGGGSAAWPRGEILEQMESIRSYLSDLDQYNPEEENSDD